MKKKHPWIKVILFGLLAAVVVGLFLFNLYMEVNKWVRGSLYDVTLTGMAALLCVAFFIWSLLSAMRESQEPEDWSATDPEKEWAKAHPEFHDGSLKVEKKEEKHGVGYWVKEFFRVSVLPLILMMGVIFGFYYLILMPIVEKLSLG